MNGLPMVMVMVMVVAIAAVILLFGRLGVAFG